MTSRRMKYISKGELLYINNPETLRWTTQNPMAEKYINFVDPNGEKIIFVNGRIGFGSPTYGRRYWNSSFINGASKYFNDNNYFFTEGVDFHSLFNLSTNYRVRAGYKYAEDNIDELTAGMKEDETFKLISHSMGAAFAEGIAKYLIEHNYNVEEIIHINAYQASNIHTISKAMVTDYQIIGDPVINTSLYFNLTKGIIGPSGNIIGADVYIRSFSKNYLAPLYIHREPIDSGSEFWESLNRKDYKDSSDFLSDVISSINKLLNLK